MNQLTSQRHAIQGTVFRYAGKEVPSYQPVQLAAPLSRSARMGVLTDSALKNPTRIVGGPGSGKSRLMGRILAWQLLTRGAPQVILDPTGGVGDNLIDKIMHCEEELRRILWQRIVYVDVAASDFVVPTPLYARLYPQETLFETASRFPSIIKSIDPALSGAPIMGANALTETAVHAGRIAVALHRQVDFVADLIDRPRQYKGELRHALARYPELEDAVAYFREMMDPTSAPLRERRVGSFRNKLLPVLSDPLMHATFAASHRGIDWQEIVRGGKTVLLDFRHELDSERRQFKMVWWFQDFIGFIKHRGTAGRGEEIFFFIDEITQLLAAPTGDALWSLTQSLNELLAVLARGYACNVVVAHQNLSQVSEAVRDILSQCGNQIIGNITNPDDAYYLARQFFQYDPYAEKKREPVWMSVMQTSETGIPLDYSWPKVIDYKSVEFTAEEQMYALMDKFRLPRFRFLVRPASAEGSISTNLYRMSIERIDEGEYPDAREVQEVLGFLRQKDGIPVETLLSEIGNRRKIGTGKSATMKDAHALSVQIEDEAEDNDDEILREKV
ncbi:MAG: ATP-binding protein [Caldilineaceae bacterium]|nr:ATP-binding protein [Caldilineaceae bacterium]